MCLFLAHELELGGGKCQVALDGEVVEEVEVLEHHAHVATHLVDVDVRCGDVLALEQDLARGGNLEQVEAAQESGLARAGRPDDDDLLAGGDVLVHVVENDVVSIRLDQVINGDHFRAATFRSC